MLFRNLQNWLKINIITSYKRSKSFLSDLKESREQFRGPRIQMKTKLENEGQLRVEDSEIKKKRLGKIFGLHKF